MPLPPLLFPGDEELGKKDDDHKRGGKTSMWFAWQHRRIGHAPHKRTLKRLGMGILAFIALYYFFKNMPTDLENPRQRPNYGFPTGPNAPPPKSSPNPPDSVSKLGREGTAESVAHDFNGPIKFYHLASTLHAVSRTRGSDEINHNVVSCGWQSTLPQTYNSSSSPLRV
jgi:hypothetical protein